MSMPRQSRGLHIFYRRHERKDGCGGGEDSEQPPWLDVFTASRLFTQSLHAHVLVLHVAWTS